mmetsp:Transcript_2193/g.4926  ORF Transcript_2193/g.4926 Transcript_2193/m.4926 type:complete len:230 (+) Transcript_2193:742-1431(+)
MHPTCGASAGARGGGRRVRFGTDVRGRVDADEELLGVCVVVFEQVPPEVVERVGRRELQRRRDVEEGVHLGADGLLRDLRVGGGELGARPGGALGDGHGLLLHLPRDHHVRLEGHLHILLVAHGARDLLLRRDGLDDGVLEDAGQLHFSDLQRLDVSKERFLELGIQPRSHVERNALLVVEESVCLVQACLVGDDCSSGRNVNRLVLALEVEVQLVKPIVEVTVLERDA